MPPCQDEIRGGLTFLLRQPILSLLNALVNWSTLYYFANLATTKCKPVAVLQVATLFNWSNAHEL